MAAGFPPSQCWKVLKIGACKFVLILEGFPRKISTANVAPASHCMGQMTPLCRLSSHTKHHHSDDPHKNPGTGLYADFRFPSFLSKQEIFSHIIRCNKWCSRRQYYLKENILLSGYVTKADKISIKKNPTTQRSTSVGGNLCNHHPDYVRCKPCITQLQLKSWHDINSHSMCLLKFNTEYATILKISTGLSICLTAN